MTNFLNYKIITTLTLSLILKLTALACSCPGRLTTEQEYKRSDLVIQGRIIGADTIYSSNTLIHDKKGTKVGRHKFSVYTEKFLRIKLVVEKNFKSISNLPDTIYILTSPESDACGYPFTPYLGKGVLPDSYYQYIVYGDKWTEKTITKHKKGKKYIGQIKKTLLGNTFFTSRCRRTQSANEEEKENLLRLLPASSIVSFITIVDTGNLSKDGIYMEGYIVEIGYEEAKKLNGKRVRVSGIVTIVNAVNNKVGEDIKQGRERDSKHILNPKIEILK